MSEHADEKPIRARSKPLGRKLRATLSAGTAVIVLAGAAVNSSVSPGAILKAVLPH